MNYMTSAPDDAGALFAAHGFLGPVPLYTEDQCKLIVSHFRSATLRPPHVWSKGYATSDRFVYDIATRPVLIDLLKQILGPGIVLWGASLVERNPEQVHIWHTDIESAAASGGFATVWVGLENMSAGSSLQLLPGSHRFGKPIQQVMREKGVSRSDVSTDLVAAWASEIDPGGRLVQPAVRDGEAIVFDGRLWHGSKNSSASKRAALLLQYARSDTPVFIPDFGNLEWPFHFTSKRPPAILVSGEGNPAGHDLLVPPSACPPDKNGPIETLIQSACNYAEDAAARWRAYPLFHGHTANAEAMESHVSVLSEGHSPHPPHAHVEEELLLIIDGVADILITDGEKPEGRVETLGPGSFVFHPAYQHHTIRNRSNAPVTYVMFKWQGCPLDLGRPLRSQVIRWDQVDAPAGSDPMWARVVLEGPTAYLKKLHAHQTVLRPGGGYAAHADEHDVAIFVMSGSIRTAKQDVGPGGLVYFAAGEPHDMQNPGTETARYLVFEFHAPRRGADSGLGRSADQHDVLPAAADPPREQAAGLKKFFRRQRRSIEKRLNKFRQ